MANQTLYDSDFYQWTQETLRQIQERDFENIDWENLAEEIEALGRAEKNAILSYLEQLLIHLLLYQYWKPVRYLYTSGWENEIDEFRSRLERMLASKSLSNFFTLQVDNAYSKAKRRAIKKFVRAGLDAPIFPEQCPYTIEQLLDLDYFPEPN